MEIADPVSRLQVDTLAKNCEEFGITMFGMNDIRQGIVHVTGPEQGAPLPGMTVVCGDSHTATHGAFGAFAAGVGTTDLEVGILKGVCAFKYPESMKISITGTLPQGVFAKDIILFIIGKEIKPVWIYLFAG